jgi:sRNA-binding carbon storage regulator CsrA
MIKVTRQIDQPILIGQSATVVLTDIDAAGVRLSMRGQVVGGPNDGERIAETHELGKGQSIHLGPQVAVTLIAVRGDSAVIGVLAPVHMPVKALPGPGPNKPSAPPRNAGEFDD